MYLKLILSIFLLVSLSSCGEDDNLLSKRWSENNATTCTEAGNYISFREQGIFYSNTVVEAMIFGKPKYVIDEVGDLLIYPYHSEKPVQTTAIMNKDLYIKLVQSNDSLSFESFYLGEKVITDRLDDQLENAVKFLDLVRCD